MLFYDILRWVLFLLGVGIVVICFDFLLSKIHPLLVFIIPLITTVFGVYLVMLIWFGDTGLGALIFFGLALVTLIVAAMTWVVSIVYFVVLKKKM